MDTESNDGLTLVLLARIPAAGIDAFRAYEAQVLPLLAEHGGTLQRRLRNADGTIEVHLVGFPSDAAFQHYRRDPKRASHAALLEQSSAMLELLFLDDVA